MSLYAISDLHLYNSVDKSMDIFGPKWQNHMEHLRKNWEKLVTENDYVIIPGDLSWAMNFEELEADFIFINSLPGTKIIGKGNHDFWWSTKTKIENFIKNNEFNTIKILFNNAFKIENKIICGTRGWYVDESYTPDNITSEYNKIISRECQRLERSILEGKKLLDIESNDEIMCFMHFPPIYNGFTCKELIDILIDNGIKKCYYGDRKSVV